MLCLNYYCSKRKTWTHKNGGNDGVGDVGQGAERLRDEVVELCRRTDDRLQLGGVGHRTVSGDDDHDDASVTACSRRCRHAVSVERPVSYTHLTLPTNREV